MQALVDQIDGLIDIRQQEFKRFEALAHAPSHVKAMVETHVASLDEPIAEIQSDIDDHIDGHAELKHDADLMSRLPGISQRASAQFVA